MNSRGEEEGRKEDRKKNGKKIVIGSDARLSLTWKKEIIKIPGRLSDLTAMNKQMVG